MNSNSSNIENYFIEFGEQYPGVTLKQFNEICRAPFKFVKKIMASGILKPIRLKYLGVFKVSKSRVKYSKKALTGNFEKGVISEERYNKRMKILNNYE